MDKEKKRKEKKNVAVGCCTLFWDPVRSVHVAACGLMSVQMKTFFFLGFERGGGGGGELGWGVFFFLGGGGGGGGGD